MFWFKPSKIHVDCFTKHEKIAVVNPIKKAHHFVPDWWKKLETSMSMLTPQGMTVQKPTMKTCYGFMELYRTGLIIPMWTDFSIEVHGDSYRYVTAMVDAGFEGEDFITSHSPSQHGNHFENRLNIKIQSPWQLREKTGVKFLYSPCLWITGQKFPKVHFLNGILDFKYQAGTHVQTFFPTEEDQYRVDFESGTPLVQLIPLSEKRVVPHIHVVDKVEYEKFKTVSAHHKFFGSYLDLIKRVGK